MAHRSDSEASRLGLKLSSLASLPLAPISMLCWAVGRVPIFEALKSILNAAKMPIFRPQILKLCRRKSSKIPQNSSVYEEGLIYKTHVARNALFDFRRTRFPVNRMGGM